MPKGGARPKVRESDRRGGARPKVRTDERRRGPKLRRPHLDPARAVAFAELARQLKYADEQDLLLALVDACLRAPERAAAFLALSSGNDKAASE
jgi:hypothetical protein